MKGNPVSSFNGTRMESYQRTMALQPQRSQNIQTWRKCTALGFPGGSDGRESACNAGHPGSIPESGRSPGEGNCYPLQYSCLKNSMDRGVWQATVMQLQRLTNTTD